MPGRISWDVWRVNALNALFLLSSPSRSSPSSPLPILPLLTLLSLLFPSPPLFFLSLSPLFFNVYFLYSKGRERLGTRGLLSAGSFAKWMQWPGLGQAEPGVST